MANVKPPSVQYKTKDELHLTEESSPGVETRPLMRVRGLHKSFGGNIVLNGVSLDLHEGEVVLLRGDNGSGKTTLLNILTGNLEPDSGSICLDTNGVKENFRFPFRWWQEINPFNHFTPERVANEAVGRTWQDVRLFKTGNLLDNIAMATPNQPGEDPLKVLLKNGVVHQSEESNQRECRELLGKTGIEDREDSSADKISLGQTKRVAILRAIRAGARILFLDEPLSGLDADGIEDILTMLASLAEHDKITLVIVEHVFNIPRILNLAQTVWTLRDGNIQIEKATRVSNHISNGFESVTQRLLDQFAGSDRQVHEQLLDGGAKLLKIAAPHSRESSEIPVLDIRSLIVGRNDRLVIGSQLKDGVIRGLSFTLHEGDIAILCAPNGWGKTTLLEALCGIIPVIQGQMILRGKDTLRLPAWERFRLGLRLIAARADLFPNLTVAEYLALSNHSLPRDIDRFPSLDSIVGDLSGGERQQLALGALDEPGTLFLLDEPFLGLDAESVAVTGERLGHFIRSMKGTVLIAVPETLNCDRPSLN
jgi:branched-chain amino acid transport system ATP-binding protein